MKLNGKEITGCGVLETALDGMTAKAYCIELQYKSERKSGGYTLKSTSLPRLAKQNDDIAAILPDFVNDNWSEGAAYFKLEKFSEKYGIKILPAESKRLAELKALIAANKAKAAKAENGESGNDETGTAKAAKVTKPKKTALERISDILDKEYKNSNVAKVNAIFEVLKSISPEAATKAADIFRATMLPECCKPEEATTK